MKYLVLISGYNQSILIKELFKAEEDENEKIVNDVSDSLIDLRMMFKKGKFLKMKILKRKTGYNNILNSIKL